ncbi:division plane positioning ATPase MipZ [Oceanomicrobium pacificus]|uniref:AAA family ATPase n=1 Tax=Oceanomicrobium pacificus TaxID=2692916 RepID=A0A6B0TYQ4_9RHOB|nr:division plane positioning ATPase MipZ [Oceanomicrobium pacificus]MXU66825.1 AAA family ATPase [Oceanomicrobium pacificus]
MAHIIVLGNEKGGSGKSTTCMHLIAALQRAGKGVGAIDLDLRQTSLFRYLDNRRAFVAREGIALPEPERGVLALSTRDSQADALAEEEENFAAVLNRLDQSCDFIVIDCPGAHTRYARMAHAAADTLITPMNDSLVDFDLLARLDPASGDVLGPSVYAEGVWKARQMRMKAGLKPLDWVVLRNRMAHVNAHNRARVGDALTELAPRIQFRIVPGFSERVIFRELFLNGLTLLDLRDVGQGSLNMSNLAARQELRDLLRALSLPNVKVSF